MSTFAIFSYIAYIAVFTGVALGLYLGLRAAKII
ncbi:cytochrome b6-f complex subunit PetL [Aphanothece hegewaldii]|nr:cytochrome b6-f complex subunit PetL [Aphanothece hegewaldii]